VKPIAFVDLQAVQDELGDQLEAAVLGVIRSQKFVSGPAVREFEDAFAGLVHADHAIGVSNGTDAIELALRALGIGPGDEVLIPANTFIATAEAVSRAGAVPRFADVNPDSGLIDLGSAESRVTDATRAVVPVHLYGRMCDMDAVLEFAHRHDLRVVEDAAQAHAAERNGARAGTVGDVGCFSFYPGKNLGAFGDAGAVVTNDGELAERVRLMRDHGRTDRNHHAVVGMNCRLDTLHAAVLTVKVPHVERWNEARREAARRYRELLPQEILDWRAEDPLSEVHHLFPVLLDDRDAVAAQLRERGIATGVHYRVAVPSTPAYADSGDDCPVADGRAARQLSLPIHPHLSADDVERVADAVAEALGVGAAR
jgi:dTDP-4-amino-4,6-dideoxygalactose transaminase